VLPVCGQGGPKLWSNEQASIDNQRKGKPIGGGHCLLNSSELTTRAGSTPAPSASSETKVPLAERQRFQASNLARWVRLPQGTLEASGCRLQAPGSKWRTSSTAVLVPEAWHLLSQTWVGSSVAEQGPVKHQVVGSIPTRPFFESPGCRLQAPGSKW
jgi:hypothetical protein